MRIERYLEQCRTGARERNNKDRALFHAGCIVLLPLGHVVRLAALSGDHHGRGPGEGHER